MPYVSVVISTYNRRSLLMEALSSALGQRDVDLEVIVVDNGSTDDTGAALAAMDDPRLRVLRNERSLGATGGRNTGLAAATGEWVGVLDDDDLWAPDKLRAQLDAAEATGRSWAYAGCVYIDRRRRVLGGVPPFPPERLMEELPVRFVLPGGMSDVVWRREALDEDGLLDERLSLTTDWDLSLRLARQGPPAAVLRPLIGYRQHNANLSQRAGTFRWEYDLIAEKFADLRGDRPLDFAGLNRFVGGEALRVGDRRAALAAYWRGARAGDRGCVPRVAATLAPVGLQPWLRRRFLSDEAWTRAGERWLASIRPVPALAVS